MNISFEDFKKLEIRIGKVLSVEDIPEADKLLKLIFEFGGEKRQIIAGIKQTTQDPQSLVGKEMPVLINLEPRKFKGFESRGMLIAADVEGEPVFLHPEREVPPGSRLSKPFRNFIVSAI